MIRILAIETSCDETAVAVVDDGRIVLSNVVASQIELHRRYGGVFPEVASRQHILSIATVTRNAIEKAETPWEDVDAVAVTFGPGLAGSLLVGVNFAKGLALARGIPLIGVNHLEAHLYANMLEFEGERPPEIEYPALCLVVSGGHTELVLMREPRRYEVVGHTLDDAAGEAFDKVGRLLGVGYPGGPAIQKAALEGNPSAFDLPRAWLEDTHNFSFSGLKTAVLRLVQGHEQNGKDIPIADVAASFQESVVDVLAEKTRGAALEYGAKQVLLAGGVSANRALRERMAERIEVPLLIPPIEFCTDNAAMVGAAGYLLYKEEAFSGFDLDVVPNLRLGEPSED